MSIFLYYLLHARETERGLKMKKKKTKKKTKTNREGRLDEVRKDELEKKKTNGKGR